ncbi:MAG: hypothetical protein ACTSXU_09100 [Promethearchaeota archaeon]
MLIVTFSWNNILPWSLKNNEIRWFASISGKNDVEKKEMREDDELFTFHSTFLGWLFAFVDGSWSRFKL